MPVLPHQDATRLIVKELREAGMLEVPRERRRPVSPLFVVAGAGISVGSVPSADGIVSECFERSGCAPATGVAEMERYAQSLTAAFPSPKSRQGYFYEKCYAARISAANLRLAHLVASGRFTDVVVTTNFDDLLARALRLFAAPVLVHDDPSQAHRFHPDRGDVAQVLHVHGSYWHYDLANLPGELSRAARSRPAEPTMASAVFDLLRTRSAVVIGYSGWEGDVVMTALRALLTGRTSFPNLIYWFCYAPDAWRTLPRWLRSHTQVHFVEPERGAGGCTSSEAVPAALGAPSLPADRVFGDFVEALGLPVPSVLSDPLGFLQTLFQTNLPPVEGDGPYDILRAARRVDRAVSADREAEGRRRASQVAVDEAWECAARADWAGMIEAAERSVLRELEPASREALWRLLEQGYQAVVRPGHDLTLLVADLAMRVAEFGPPAERDRRAIAAFRRGRGLFDRGQTHEAQAQWAAVVEHYGRETTPLCGQAVASAQLNLGYLLLQDGRNQDALRSAELLLGRIEGNAALAETASIALLNKAGALDRLGRSEEALAVLEALASRFGTSRFPKSVPHALSSRAAILHRLGRADQALAVLENLRLGFSTETDADVREALADGLLTQGVILHEAGRNPEALATLTALVDGLRSEASPRLRRVFVRGLRCRGVALGGIGRPDDALADYAEVLRTHEAETGAGREEDMAAALLGRGNLLHAAGDPAGADAAWAEVVSRFGGATGALVRDAVAKARLQRAALAFASGDCEAAFRDYSAVVAAVGGDIDLVSQQQVAIALVGSSASLFCLGRDAEALVACADLLERARETTNPEIRLNLAISENNRAFTLTRLGRLPEAIACTEALVARIGDDAEPALRAQLAIALQNLGFRLFLSGELTRACAPWSELSRWPREGAPPQTVDEIATASVNLSEALRQLSRPTEALAAADVAMEVAGADASPASVRTSAFARINRGRALLALGRPAEALLTFDEVLSAADLKDFAACRAETRVSRGEALRELGRLDEARAEWSVVAESPVDPGDTAFAAEVARARQALAAPGV